MFREGVESPIAEAHCRIVSSKNQIAVFLIGFALMLAQMSLLTWAKTLLPITGYWADPLLARTDSAIFGSDPIRLAHLLPAGRLVDFQYSLFLPWTMAAIWLSLLKNKGVVQFFLIVAILGIGLIFVLPSAGPIYYQRMGFGDRFADVELQPYARLFSDYLWAELEAKKIGFGAGISAFPSMHVALTAWAAIVLKAYGRWPAVAGWIFCAMTWFGSVYLGWHYAIDGLVGIIGSLMIFKATAPGALPYRLRTLRGRLSPARHRS